MTQDNRDYITRTSPGLIPGIIVFGMGVLFLLNNLNIVRIYEWWLLWPVVLIAIGLTKLVDSPRPHEKTGGAIMVVVGGVFLSSNLGWLSWRFWQFWPLALIAVGLVMLISRTTDLFSGHSLLSDPNHNWHWSRGWTTTDRRPDAIAIFGGFKRQIVIDDFRHANFVAIFGGGEIDLRHAQIQAGDAIVDVTALFGGFEIKVPPNWLVVNDVVGIFGGTGDETQIPPADDPATRRLILRGVAIFGGLGLKN